MNFSLQDSFENKNVLITGGIGFIGSNLAIRLAELGARVTLIDSILPDFGGNLFNIEPIKNQVIVNISDVRDEHAMKYLIKNQDFLFNLAGQNSHMDSMINPVADLEINSKAQLSILEACRLYNPAIRIVFSSTRQVYGKPNSLPVDERHPLNPVDVNGINKISGESYHILYQKVYGIRTAVLRLTNTYGPRMRVKDARQTFLGIWIKNILTGKKISIFGDGAQIRDFNYVDDVIEALLLSATNENAYGQIFNLGADDPLSLLETAKIMIEQAGRGSYEIIPFPPERKAIDIGDYYADYRQIRSRLGWIPKTSFKNGIKNSIEFFAKYGEHYFDSLASSDSDKPQNTKN